MALALLPHIHAHVFACRFNYRSTHYMAMNGFYNFLNWFDSRAWYPLGRIVGGTVSYSCIIHLLLCNIISQVEVLLLLPGVSPGIN